MFIKITGHFNLTWADQSIKQLFLELSMNVTLFWTLRFLLYLCLSYILVIHLP